MDTNHRRPVPARVTARIERRRSSAAGTHGRPNGCRTRGRHNSTSAAIRASLADFSD